VRTCIYRGECSYMYEYLRLYYVSKKRIIAGYPHMIDRPIVQITRHVI
jgi:hypothetical protein